MTRGALAWVVSIAALGACSSSSSGGGASSCGSGTVSGSGPLASFTVARATATDNGNGAVGVCLGTSRGQACGGKGGSPTGALSVCFFLENLQTPSLDPGTYPIGNGGNVTASASVEQCAPDGSWPELDSTSVAPPMVSTATGSITITAITSTSVTGSATVTFPSGDSVDETFDALILNDAPCPGG